MTTHQNCHSEMVLSGHNIFLEEIQEIIPVTILTWSTVTFDNTCVKMYLFVILLSFLLVLL